MPKPKVIVFDVNETLLDLTAMRASVNATLNGREDLLPLWFANMLHYSLVHTSTGSYQDFADIGAASLVMVAKHTNLPLDLTTARAAIVGPMTSLPPHKEVKSSLQALKAQDYHLVSLTNSSSAGVKAQFEHAELTEYFERRFSVEEIKKFKPHPAPYNMVLEELNVEPSEVLMVAAHAWDLMGASAVGMQTAFIRRPGASLYPHAAQPDYIVNDLMDLVEVLAKSFPAITRKK